MIILSFDLIFEQINILLFKRLIILIISLSFASGLLFPKIDNKKIKRLGNIKMSLNLKAMSSDGFSRFDLTIYVKDCLKKRLDISLKIDNLTNSDAGFPGARGGNGYFPGRHIFTSRAFYIKINYNLIELLK